MCRILISTEFARAYDKCNYTCEWWVNVLLMVYQLQSIISSSCGKVYDHIKKKKKLNSLS